MTYILCWQVYGWLSPKTLIINEEEMKQGIDALDDALKIADELVEMN